MRNLTMLTDLYQLTMMQGYFETGMADETDVFDRFYRINPCGGGYSIVAGLDHVIDYINNLKFSADDLAYLLSLGFKQPFVDYLANFHFTGSIWAVPEGTVVFPGEPLLKVKSTRMEAQFIETAVSMFLNHESLIATRASRIRWAAGKDYLMEFGLRRAQGADAGIYGARAAVIGGFDATSNILAGKMFNIPVAGTMAHSWIMNFPTELEAFQKFVEICPDNAILLVDTFDTLKSGVPNAIKTFTKMRKDGISLTKYGIRLDSGDLAYLSKKARKMLDAAGFESASITASNDLDENLIASLKQQGATINAWGVGTKLITSEGCSSFGGVYKLAAANEGSHMIPKIKISDNPEKITNPAEKQLYRIYDRNAKIIADLITLEHEEVREDQPLVLMNETHDWKRMTLEPGTFSIRQLMAPVFRNGLQVYSSPTVAKIKAYAENELSTLWDEYRRLVNPHIMKVDISDKLYDLKQKLIREHRVV